MEHQATCGEMTLVNPMIPSSKVKLKYYSYENLCGDFYPED